MGQKRRGIGLRALRILEQLYPGASFRPILRRPVALLSVIYVLSIIIAGWWLVVPRTLFLDFPSHSIRVTCILLVFNWCAFACTASYLLTALIDPGAVPESWRPVHDDGFGASNSTTSASGLDLAESSPSLQAAHARSDAVDAFSIEPRSSSVVVRSNVRALVPPAVVLVSGSFGPNGNLRYCRICRIYKPARTHHCSVCKRCTLQMDHHCPFTGNTCIGFMNRKYFILFLYYASVSCTFVIFIAPRGLMKMVDDLGKKSVSDGVVSLVGWLLAYMLCFLHAIILAGFAGYHSFLILKNCTTIEHSDPSRDEIAQYNRGYNRNWRAVFGSKPLLWFAPVNPGREGDGIRWRNADESV